LPTVAQAAKTMNVGEDAVRTARRVRKASKTLASKVKAGKISLNAADKAIHPAPAPPPAGVFPAVPVVALDGVSRPPVSTLSAAEVEQIQQDMAKRGATATISPIGLSGQADRVVDGVPTESQAAQLKEIADFAAASRINQTMGESCAAWLDTAAGREWLAEHLTQADLEAWLLTDIGRNINVVNGKVVDKIPPPQITATAVDAWLETDDGGKWIATLEKTIKATCVTDTDRIKKPLTLPQLKVELVALTKRIPDDSDRQKYGDAISDAAADQMRLAQNGKRKSISAYTR